ncbi:uncharacterized protein F4812DRAFT_454319 [Daldinia caldariorum]|uniref:uncharacterized protein n=1 Tax=Daldinia caldariorum TaxID=326644 RepID=UPI0020075BED|nr:uncharacterized protein F4812DRAFT_454319 [Daldinia caldariorum]KAI1472506.1 hypothetical protein F4812DRAFT_454319 [Daldinia caldariorum]
MDQDPNTNTNGDPLASFLEPVSGVTLYEMESARREGLNRRGRVLKTGCAEVDDAVLLGGLERGCVVGVSAEDVEFGLLVGLQTVAHTLVLDDEGGNRQRVAIVTTLTPAAILPTLRDVVKAQVRVRLGPTANQKQEVVSAEVRRCLERISISRVFDVEGLWEVLGELETPPARGHDDGDGGNNAVPGGKEAEIAPTTTATEGKGNVSRAELWNSPRPKTAKEGNKTVNHNAPPSPSPKTWRMEVADSEDEEELSLSSSPPGPPEQQSSVLPPPESPPKLLPSLSPPIEPALQTTTTTTTTTTTPNPILSNNQEIPSHIPDLILITHFSTLLANLFTRSADNKPHAHDSLRSLSSHLRSLARSSSSAGPLVMLLNSTTATSPSPSASASASAAPPSAYTPSAKDKPQDPTLRSVFVGRGGKPAFGATFAQFVDVHLMCSRVPRTRGDVLALGRGVGVGMKEGVRWCWVVEVLLDEVGVEVKVEDDSGGSGNGNGSGSGGDNKRIWKSREQRWGAVDVRSKVRLVDAVLNG